MAVEGVTNVAVSGWVRRTIWPVAARPRVDGWWHRHPEPLGKQPQVVAVAGAERVAEVMTDLEPGGQAAHLPAPDHAHPGQPLRRVGAPGAPAQLLPAIAMAVEDHRMQVNLPAAGVDQDVFVLARQ